MSAFAHLCLNCMTREVVGQFSDENGEGFCSDECYTKANEECADCFDSTPDHQYDAEGDGWGAEDILSMYDDDPSPYAGTYSEE